ncbi:class I SAM-dependent methyltransferase [Aeromicrobium sp. YIM 150415]|uniref:class I SAM-dependent methyltransferase n=1 Tax=Aeromicrobium sp. YIM 150415 TaxID=2803912 RepID=UPI0019628EFA|nr:class I SAM-dependent methyltransferase [Aeromicrobium sp. YIM 150415]MBM9461937.1 class I SAM-dependent methyltransferase [Aeromicrobium sp. YIM 150415]
MRESTDPNHDGDRVLTHETAQEAAYWRRFYEHVDFAKGSSFFEFANTQDSLPTTILDIGCGEGRDSFAFAQTGKYVVGLDRSDMGVARAREKADADGLGERLKFSICDVADTSSLASIVASVREQRGGAAICFYMRFFLHSIPEETQDILLTTISDQAGRGDVLMAEFRTDKDEKNQHVFGDGHYRRYQNADDFSKNIRDQYGWDVDFETEETGLSPYKGEDPVLYRVLARRS